MKKLLALIVMIVMTLGISSASAQHSAASFGINTFCQPLSKTSGYTAEALGIPKLIFNSIQVMKPENVIYSSLLRAGFSCTYKKYFTEYDESVSEYVTYLKATYVKAVSGGKIIVKQDWFGSIISFPNKTERDKFLKTIKAEQTKGYIYTSDKYYWLGVRIEVNGNTIKLFATGGA